MPYVSQAQQKFFHANEGKGGITPAVVQEFDDATQDPQALPERVGSGPGASPSGQIASHHAVLANHYKGLAAKAAGSAHLAALKAIEAHHRGLAVAHAQRAKLEPDPKLAAMGKSPVIARAVSAASKRGLMPPAPQGAPPVPADQGD